MRMGCCIQLFVGAENPGFPEKILGFFSLFSYSRRCCQDVLPAPSCLIPGIQLLSPRFKIHCHAKKIRAASSCVWGEKNLTYNLLSLKKKKIKKKRAEGGIFPS